MNLSLFTGKEFWIILFALGVQLHFYGIIFPVIKDSFIQIIGMGLVIVSSAIMLVLYNTSNKNKSNVVGVRSS